MEAASSTSGRINTKLEEYRALVADAEKLAFELQTTLDGVKRRDVSDSQRERSLIQRLRQQTFRAGQDYHRLLLKAKHPVMPGDYCATPDSSAASPAEEDAFYEPAPEHRMLIHNGLNMAANLDDQRSRIWRILESTDSDTRSEFSPYGWFKPLEILDAGRTIMENLKTRAGSFEKQAVAYITHRHEAAENLGRLEQQLVHYQKAVKSVARSLQ